VPEILVATDADWILDEVRAALGGDTTTIRWVRNGKDVVPALQTRAADLVVLDLQIGNMGGMATCMEIRLEAGADRLPEVGVLMLLDRSADVFLAQRCNADGWLVKPLDAFRLRRAADAILRNETYQEGVPAQV
jgi:DNA-binding response OmpR family regulator